MHDNVTKKTKNKEKNFNLGSNLGTPKEEIDRILHEILGAWIVG